MKTEGRLNGTRSKRLLGTALVLGAVLTVLPALQAPARDANAEAPAGKNTSKEPCMDSIVFYADCKDHCIGVSEFEKRVDRYWDGQAKLICFENYSESDITISFTGDWPFEGKPKPIDVKSKGKSEGYRFAPKVGAPVDPPTTSSYPFKWSGGCVRKDRGNMAGAKMIVQP